MAETKNAQPEAQEETVEPAAEAHAQAGEPAEEPAPTRAAKPRAASEAAELEPESVAEAEPAADAEPEPAAEAVAQAAEVPEPPAEAAAGEPAAEPRTKRKRLPRAERRQRAKPRRSSGGDRSPIVRLPKPESERGRRQERRGVVVSSAMNKTIVVRVDTLKSHPWYKKIVRRSTKFHVHDERNEAKVGDTVRIVETRPLSRTKHWRLAEIIEVAK